MTSKWILYKTKNLLNGKFYIGVHKIKDNNFDDGYLGSGKLLRLAISKYGAENFERTTMGVYNDRDEAYNFELLLVNERLISNPFCYNLTIGGYKNSGQTEDIKKRISETLSGRKLTKEHARKIGDWHRGKEIPEEMRQRISKKLKGRPGTPHTEKMKKYLSKVKKEYYKHNDHPWKGITGPEHYNYGFRHTEEYKKKMSEARQGEDNSFYGKSHTKEQKKKWSKDRTGHNNYVSRAVIQFDKDDKYIKEWKCIKYASKKLNIHHISSVCKGKRKTAGGFKWKYKENVK